MTDRPQPLAFADVGRAVVSAFAKQGMVELELARLENGRYPTSDQVDRAIREYRDAIHPSNAECVQLAKWKDARASLKGWGGGSAFFVVERR